ncbi:hypothetical protein FB565_004763 [Actinoplanes lutulentus]|uniref:LPXTG-motif cell wall-anchored protein n=1 Tax=Actinoplanes lutulentus TaxID=1287878 RepID=A0A327ZDN5_9ACTN|nr:hypothetical protein [Actinoplanes lutulentus]MBB2945030.1 hypothetical protein [Actinoplanes lutulentus]RAK31825.1 hypothetical protein B0I29_11473 [Actinoplanes lutulentus]
MRLRTLFHRLALSALVSGLAVTGLALPAQAAEEEFPFVAVLGPETVTVISGQSKTVELDIYNLTTIAAKDVVLSFGTKAKPIGADLGFTPPEGCDQTTCDLGDVKPGERRKVKFSVKPVAGAGPAIHVPVATWVGGLPSFETSIAVVQTAKGGVDLEVSDIANLKVGRGKSANVPFEVRNTGNRDVEAVGLFVFTAYSDVVPVLNYRNCLVDDELGGVICVIDEPLAGGGTFTLPESAPLRIKVKPDAPGPYEYPVIVGAVGLSGDYLDDFARKTAGAAGAELKLQSVPTASADEPAGIDDLNPDDNLADFTVAVPKSAADSKAIGGVFEGSAGQTVSVEVGVQNLGPTGTVPASFQWFPYVHVTMPTGVALSEIDESCLAGTSPTELSDIESLDGRDYVCALDGVAKNAKATFTFTGEISEGEHAPGTVTVDGGVQDAKSGNDTAALTVKLTSGGEGAGEALPITGAPAGLLAGGGVALLLAGVIAYRMARRRRIITVVE